MLLSYAPARIGTPGDDRPHRIPSLNGQSMLGLRELSALVSLDDCLANIDQNIGLVAVGQILGQRLEINRISDPFDQFLA